MESKGQEELLVVSTKLSLKLLPFHTHTHTHDKPITQFPKTRSAVHTLEHCKMLAALLKMTQPLTCPKSICNSSPLDRLTQIPLPQSHSPPSGCLLAQAVSVPLPAKSQLLAPHTRAVLLPALSCLLLSWPPHARPTLKPRGISRSRARTPTRVPLTRGSDTSSLRDSIYVLWTEPCRRSSWLT